MSPKKCDYCGKSYDHPGSGAPGLDPKRFCSFACVKAAKKEIETSPNLGKQFGKKP
jgi:hypothetical protein